MKPQKVLLVNPPFYRVLGSHYNGISLGIAYIAAVLNREGHDAWLYNADFLNHDQYKTLYKVYHDFPTYIEIFKDENHPIWTETVESIVAFQPDWIGWTSYTANVSAVRLLSNAVAKRLPGVKQVVGGVQSTLDPELLLKLPAVDYAVRREGEFATLNLINGKDPKDIQGLQYRKYSFLQGNGESPVISPLDPLPLPERDKFWTHGGRPASPEERVFMDVSYCITLRGCPYRCTFCASPQIWGRTNLQYRSPKNIVDEMELLKNKYWKDKHIDYALLCPNSKTKAELLKDACVVKDNTIVYFVDDVFTLKKKRCIQIMQEMVDRNLNVPWKCESRADNIDDEIAELMAKSCCKRVKLGVESGSDRMLKQMKKDETKDDMRKGIKSLKKYNIPVTVHLLTGFPGETDDDLQETIDFAKEIEADYYSPSILSPYYGTDIYLDALRDGVPLEKEPWEYFFHHSKKLLVNNTMSEQKLEEFWRLCDVRNHV
jgi:anaerobic magnesium-protoporphyrin IX monomethyl ester cyclase